MKRLIIAFGWLAAIATTILSAQASTECSDGACGISAKCATASEIITDMPTCAIAPVKQGPRLDTLDGKTIAIVGGSFMASVTYPERERTFRLRFRRNHGDIPR